MWSCMAYNATLDSVDYRTCQDLGFVISIISLLYLVVCFPVGLCCNTLLVVVNLSNKVSMTMPDVYFVNIGIAGLLLNLVAAAELLGPGFTQWPLWEQHNSKLHITLLILFNVSSLVTMYSTTLLSLDYYIERALPRTYMSSVYNTKHVCGFIWGGAVLTSFSSLLFYVCSHVSAKVVECSKMQNKEVADVIMLTVGYVVPVAAVLYAMVLIFRIRRKSTPLDADSGAQLDPSIHCLLLALVCIQILLWTPYYLVLLAHTLLAPGAREAGRQGTGMGSSPQYFLRCLSVLLALSSSLTIPLVYKRMNKNFSQKLKELLSQLTCRQQACSHEQSMARHTIT